MTHHHQELTEHFRQIAEIAGDVAWVFDLAGGELVYLSPSVEDLLGYSVDEIKRQVRTQGDGTARLQGGLAERLRRFADGDQSRRRVVREFDQASKNGGNVPIELISTLVLDAHGKPSALAGLVRDLSGRRHQEREQKRFASMLSHEFRTPLSTIDGAIQRLEVTGVTADEPTRQRYRKIQAACDRLIAMVDEYLSPDRMEAMGRTRQANSIAPRALLDEAMAQARAAGRVASMAADDLPASLRCDPAGMKLALKALVDNAIKYTPPNTPMALTGRQAVGGGLELLVTDNGPGIAPDDLAQLFSKSFRGRNASGVAGSGLGLYMARTVVEVHGGTIEARNRAEGGAEFRIWLPAHQPDGK